MAARLSPSCPESVPATAAVLRTAEFASVPFEARPRVVSVSPTAVDAGAAGDASARHQQLAARLESLVEECRAQDAQATKSSRQLQERLRLGARMLRAFQAQIDRVESTLKSQQEHERQLRQLDAEIELKVAAAQARLDTTLRQFIAALDESSQAAIQIHEQRLDQRGGETQVKTGDDLRSRVTDNMTWLTSTMRDVAMRVEQLAALSAVPENQPTVETTVDAPLKFQRYANQAQG